MANRKKKQPVVTMDSYGIYEPWNSSCYGVPKLDRFADEIPIRPDIEFGYILDIQGGRGCKIEFIMEHPPFHDAEGNVEPPFTGELYVRENDFQFFLGDTVWEPFEDKAGAWRLITRLDGEVVADKTFTLML